MLPSRNWDVVGCSQEKLKQKAERRTLSVAVRVLGDVLLAHVTHAFSPLHLLLGAASMIPSHPTGAVPDALYLTPSVPLGQGDQPNTLKVSLSPRDIIMLHSAPRFLHSPGQGKVWRFSRGRLMLLLLGGFQVLWSEE